MFHFIENTSWSYNDEVNQRIIEFNIDKKVKRKVLHKLNMIKRIILCFYNKTISLIFIIINIYYTYIVIINNNNILFKLE